MPVEFSENLKIEAVMHRKKIFDCFIFFDEIEILKLRLAEHYDHVDSFVICEATKTFRGKDKPLYFMDNAHLFDRYKDKIIHLIVDDLPGESIRSADQIGEYDQEIWGREHHQRNAIRRAVKHLQQNDIVIVSDCDEIISPQAFNFLKNNDGYFMLDMSMYQFFVNMRSMSSGWQKVFAYSYYLEPSLPDYNFIRANEKSAFKLLAGQNHHVLSAGWHLTFLGGMKKVENKLRSYSHTDGWQRSMWEEANLREQMIALREVGGNKILKYCELDNTFPKSILDNANYYIQNGWIKEQHVRLQELEQFGSSVDFKYQQVLAKLDESTRRVSTLEKIISEAGIITASIINRIPNSKDFLLRWNCGMQSTEPFKTNIIEGFVQENAVMCHERDGRSNPDSNVGYFSSIPFKNEVLYTASCYVWLASDFCGDAIDISIDGWLQQFKHIARLDVRNEWQRIWVTSTAPKGYLDCNIVLRVYGDASCSAYSTCWQFEEGERPTEYMPTSAAIEADIVNI